MNNFVTESERLIITNNTFKEFQNILLDMTADEVREYYKFLQNAHHRKYHCLYFSLLKDFLKEIPFNIEVTKALIKDSDVYYYIDLDNATHIDALVEICKDPESEFREEYINLIFRHLCSPFIVEDICMTKNLVEWLYDDKDFLNNFGTVENFAHIINAHTNSLVSKTFRKSLRPDIKLILESN